MAVSATVDRAKPGETTQLVTVTFDSSYPTGGEPVTAATFGLSADPVAVVQASAARPQASFPLHTVLYDSVNKKLVVKVAAGTEVVAATDLSTFVVDLLVFSA